MGFVFLGFKLQFLSEDTAFRRQVAWPDDQAYNVPAAIIAIFARQVRIAPSRLATQTVEMKFIVALNVFCFLLMHECSSN